MKIFIQFLLILSLLLFGCGEQESLDSVNGPVSEENALMKKGGDHQPIKVHRAKKPIVIDGKKKDWKRAKKTKLKMEVMSNDSPIENKHDLSSDVRMLWDDDNLYFFASIKDQDINTDSGLLFEKDGFEIYIDGGNHKTIGVLDFPPPNFTPAGYADSVDFFRFIPGETSVLSAYGIIDTTGFEFAIVLTKKGYDVEVKMPLANLPGFVGAPGHVFGVEFQTNDNDYGTRESFLKWNSGLDDSYFNPSIFGTAVLDKKKK